MSNPDFQNGFVAGYSVGRTSSPPSGQVDYIQNDPNAKDYIKNRPFYEATAPLEIELPALEDAANMEGPLGLIAGNIYTVFDGTNTIEVEAADLTDIIGIEGVGIEGPTFTVYDKVYFVEDTEDILYNPENYAYISETPIKITGESYRLKTLDSKFLSDDIVTDENLLDFKNKYTDYTANFVYEADKLSEIMVTPQYPCFKLYTELVNRRSGSTIIGKAVWAVFDIMLAKVTASGEIIQLLESPLDISYNKNLFRCNNLESIKDNFITVEGYKINLGEAFKDMVDDEIVTDSFMQCNLFTVVDSSSGERLANLQILHQISVVLGDMDGVPFGEILKQELDSVLEQYDGLAGLVYINEPTPDVVKANYLGGTD